MMPSITDRVWTLIPINRAILIVCPTLLLVILLALVVQAQPAPEVAIDRAFRYESSFSSSNSQGQSIGGFKKWMGTFQRIRIDGNTYIAVFDRGSVPIDAKFKANGSVESLSFGCPISKSLSLSDAPSNIRQTLSKCAGFKS
jgi:hypothetical protein